VPKVSVLMPVYNTNPQYLRIAIESVLNQTYSDFELLICDDESKPYIKEIIDTYDDKRIKYLRNKKNLGAAGTRNKMIDNANGKYLALLDSDDFAYKNRLEKQVVFLDKNKNVGVCASFSTINNDTLLHNREFNSDEIEKHLMFSGNIICNSSVMLRKSVLDKNNIRYRTEYIPAEDYALYLDLINLTKFAMLPEVLCDYRSYPENISHTKEKFQKERAATAQLACIERYFNTKIPNKDVLINFFVLDIPKKSSDLINSVNYVCDLLKDDSKYRDEFYNLCKNCYRVMCYKNRSIGVQFKLLFSPLRKYFRQKFSWQFFCFITRGILGVFKR